MEFPYQMQQFPEELDWLAALLLRNAVSTLFTIGVYTGGVEWWISKRYQQAGSPLQITGVDTIIHPDLLAVQEDIKLTCPLVDCSFLNKDVRDCGSFPIYDAVFIDGDHSEEGMKHDIPFALAHASKLVALHDIVEACAHTRAVSAAWQKLRDEYWYDEIRAHPDRDKGIGVVYLRTGV